MDRLEAMSLFVAAVEAGSLSAAARRFGIPLATVSRKVSDLERHLNTRLLNRSTRRLTPTDAGVAYLAACRRILDDVGEAERAAAGEYSAPTGELAITAPVVFGRLHVLPVITGFLAAYPDVDIRLTLADRITQLVEDHFDLALRIGQLPDSSLVAIAVGSIRRVVCASPAYLAAHGTPSNLSDLDHHTCIVFARGRERYPWRFHRGQKAVSYMPRGSLLTGDAEHVRAAVLCGLGVAQAPRWLLEDEIRSGQVSVLLPALQPERLPLNIVYAAGRRVPMRVRVLIDYLLAQ